MGLVGAGWVARERYLPVLQRMSGVVVEGLFDRHADRARSVAADVGVKAFGSLEDLTAHHLDAAFVCTAPFTHAELTVQLLGQSVSVMVEKPMAMDSGEARAMIDAAATSATKLCVSHNLLFSRSFSRVRDWIRAGKVGEIKHISAYQASSRQRRLPTWYEDLPGGLFFDEAPHMLYLLDALLEDVRIVDAWARPGASGDISVGTFEQLGARFEGPEGVPATLHMLFDSPVSEWLVTIMGHRAIAVLDLFRDIALLIRSDGSHSPSDILKTSGRTVVGHARGVVSTGVRYTLSRQFWGHDVIVGDFVSSVREGNPVPVAGEDGLRILRLQEQLLAAARGA